MKELIQIQKELKAPKNQINSFGKYKYRNCEDILESVKPLLNKNNCYLTITDNIIEVGNVLIVNATATITNEQKEKISVSAQAGIDIHKKGMDVSQCFGSSSSYARKYALNGLFLIDDTKDADNKSYSPTDKNIIALFTKRKMELTSAKKDIGNTNKNAERNSLIEFIQKAKDTEALEMLEVEIDRSDDELVLIFEAKRKEIIKLEALK
jgi:ERF superfamily